MLEGLIDELARVLHQASDARELALRAGFSPADLPNFDTAGVFWAHVVRAANDGKTKGGVEAIVDQVKMKFPGNRFFVCYGTRFGAAADRRDRYENQEPEVVLGNQRQSTGKSNSQNGGRQSKSDRVVWELVLKLDDISDEELTNVLGVLRQISGEPDIMLRRTYKGSIVLELEMPESAAIRLSELVAAGRLASVLDCEILAHRIVSTPAVVGRSSKETVAHGVRHHPFDVVREARDNALSRMTGPELPAESHGRHDRGRSMKHTELKDLPLTVIDAALDGDGPAFRLFYEHYDHTVRWAVGMRVFRWPTLVPLYEDLVQDVWICLVRQQCKVLRYHGHDRGTPFWRFLAMVSMRYGWRLAKRHLGHSGIELVGVPDLPEDDELGPMARMLSNEFVEQTLSRARELLGAADFTLFEGYYVHCESIRDIAQRLGITENTAYNRHRRLRSKLEKLYEELLGDQPRNGATMGDGGRGRGGS